MGIVCFPTGPVTAWGLTAQQITAQQITAWQITALQLGCQPGWDPGDILFCDLCRVSCLLDQ